jgi:HTH-type transcriptional regulator / antitoxin HipB
MDQTTFIRTPADLGSIIRDRRKKLGLGQADLAERIGVNRKWVIGIERGRARAELGLVLRAVDALGLRLSASADSGRRSPSLPSINIDDIVSSARKAKP